jgi:putative endonuclease
VIGWLLRLSDALRDRGRRRFWPADQAAGRRGEDLAHRYLERRGMTVVARNWQPSAGPGEIDLVAWEGDRLVFVEVKARGGDEFGAPERNVDAGKREALERAARNYARRAGVAWERVRFDLVGVVLGDPPAISHRKDAFRANRTL